MTKIDKGIINTINGAALLALIIGLIIDYGTTFQVIACIAAVLYTIFALFHIAIMMPLVMIFIWLEENVVGYFHFIKEKSVIIYKTLMVIGAAFIIIFIYVVVPLLIAMLFNNSISIDAASKLIGKILTSTDSPRYDY